MICQVNILIKITLYLLKFVHLITYCYLFLFNKPLVSP